MAKKSPRIAWARRAYPLPVATAIGLLLLPMAGGSSAIVPPGGAGASRIAGLEDAQAVSLSNPMPGARISAAWGAMQKPFTREISDHRGIDLVGPAGSEIHAAAPGRVEEATTHYSGGAAYGTVVILDHGDGIKTLYAHLDRLDVEKGQRVSRGDVLGTQGATGQVKGGDGQVRTMGGHLHFEVRENGEFRDPALFVAAWQREGGSRRK